MAWMRALLRAVWHFLKSPRAILYLAIALLSASLDMREELLFKVGLGECERIDVAISILYRRYTTLYSRLESGFRKPRSHYVRLVVLAPETTPKDSADIFAIVCKKREYLAGVIRDLGALQPAVIAMDLFPQAVACGGQEDSDLQDAIRDVSATIPIVIAKRTESMEELIEHHDPELEALRKAGIGDRDLALEPHLPLQGALLKYGISRLSCDTRAVPFSWMVYDPKEVLEGGAKPEPQPALAYQTATTYDSELRTAIDAFRSRHDRAVITFLPEEAFRSIVPADIRRCIDSKDAKCLAELRDAFRGKIALIGELSDTDQHNTVLGKVSGYLLHANYAEALLDDRYASPLSPWLELLLAALSILIIVLIFDISEEWEAVPKVLRAMAGLVLAYGLILVLFVACSALHLYGGVEADFWAPLVPLPLLELIYTWRVKSRPAETHHGPTHGKGRPHRSKP